MPSTLLKDLVSARISMNEGDPFWTCELSIASPGEFLTLTPNDQFVIDLQGEQYHFYVDRAGLNRSGPAEITGTIGGVGLGVNLDHPRRKLITKVFPSKNASEIVQELLDNRVILWDLVDWPVLQDRFGVEFSSRVSAAKQLVEAAGGVLEGTPEGDFTVRHLWPTAPWDYSSETPVHIFNDIDSILRISFDYSIARYIDTVVVRDIPAQGYQDRVEVEDVVGEPLKKIVHVYPSPWRTTFDLKTTGGVAVTMNLLGTFERTEIELMEIVNGQATAKYPVKSISSITWQYLDLLGLFHNPYSPMLYSTHSTEKYSLARVTYKVESVDYEVTVSASDDIQFYIEDVPLI